MKQINKVKLSITLSLIPLSQAYATQDKLYNSHIQKPPFLLAQSYQSATDVLDFFVSEKLDGIRAYWNGNQLLTRTGRKINAPDWFTENFPSTALDGELWIGRGQFESLLSAVNKNIPIENEWLQVKYMVFDLPLNLSPFSQRYLKLKHLMSISSSQYLNLVKQENFNSSEALNDHLKMIVAKGGEGLMLHRKNSLYQAKRSLDLQKLKPFDDDEATVIAHYEGKGKYQGLLGAIEVVNSEGKKFKIGSGFSLKERQYPPPINSQITYRYRGKTKYNTPRFATFLRLREKLE